MPCMMPQTATVAIRKLAYTRLHLGARRDDLPADLAAQSRAFGLLGRPSFASSAHQRPNTLHVLASVGIAFYPEERWVNNPSHCFVVLPRHHRNTTSCTAHAKTRGRCDLCTGPPEADTMEATNGP